MRLVGRERRTPRFGDDLAVAKNHNGVDAVELFVELRYRLSENAGVEADFFRESARQGAVRVEILRLRDSDEERQRGKENKG